jgi:hypothetical protein
LANSVSTKTDPFLTVAEQAFVALEPFRRQLIEPAAPDWLLTCPPPVSPVPGVIVSVNVPGPFPKFARTLGPVLALTVIVQVIIVPEQSSCHPVKTDPAPGVSINVTFAPTA